MYANDPDGTSPRRAIVASLIVWFRRPDQRSADGLRHTVEDDDTIARAERRQGFVGFAEALLAILPIVGHPDVAGRANADVNLHLQSAADVAARRRDRVAGLHPGRAVLGVKAAEFH